MQHVSDTGNPKLNDWLLLNWLIIFIVLFDCLKKKKS